MAEQTFPAPSLVGTQVGPYHVRRKIGQGGMGVVYEGWDERLERVVAIKTLHGASESAEGRSRLWREARSLARASHPHVCQVFDVLEEGELLVLVLELLEGQSLSGRLAGGAVLPSEAVAIERQILQALVALHALGIVHRDLKPSNVFLTQHGVKLLDFGLARTVSAAPEADAATALTVPGTVVGTPQYMSPEQARGQVAGPGADIFAAGCIFYEMLTGKRAFEGASAVDILHAVLHYNPPPLSGSRAVEALDQVIRCAMSKRPENRYPSAREMLEAIDAVPYSSATAATPQVRTVMRLIALPFRILKKDEESDFLAYSLPDAISNSLAGLDSLIVRSSAVAARFEGPQDPKRLAVEADVDAFLTGSVMHVGDRIRLTCQLVEAPSGAVIWSDAASSLMQDLFKIQDELSERIVHSIMLPLSEREQRNFRRDVPASAMAYEYYLRANQIAVNRTLDNIRIARDLYRECLQEDPNYAPAWARLGRVYGFLDKFGGGAGDVQNLTDDAFQRAFALNPDLALAHNLYTAIECDQGHAPEAMVRLLTRARVRRNDADLFAGLVQACRYCGELQASIAAHERARHLDPGIVTSVAHTYFLLGQYQRTIDDYGITGAFYLDCAALAVLGDNHTALSTIRQRDSAGTPTGAVRAIMRSLRAYLEGDIEGCLHATEIDMALARKTPESLYYLARQLARINQPEKAVSVLFEVIEGGFLCGSALMRDPWLESVRSSPRFSDLRRLAEQRHHDAHNAFLAADGPHVLGISTE